MSKRQLISIMESYRVFYRGIDGSQRSHNGGRDISTVSGNNSSTNDSEATLNLNAGGEWGGNGGHDITTSGNNNSVGDDEHSGTAGRDVSMSENNNSTSYSGDTLNQNADRFLKRNQDDQSDRNVRSNLQEPTATQGGKKSCMLLSVTEENSIQVESLTCWICQEEFSSRACLIKHYDDHM